MTLAEINRRIKLAEPNVELVRGEGYHYYVYSDDGPPLVYETESVWCPYTGQRSPQQWIADGIEYGKRMRAVERSATTTTKLSLRDEEQ